ncbi:hypothetical protein FLAVO9AF_240005 [Flavobacterium sp. 9AF]|nr:hypothetical protein FLAVO9AF_240005 [Flavobacterium sp. 9AF]
MACSVLFRKLFHHFTLCACVSEYSKISLYLLWFGVDVTLLRSSSKTLFTNLTEQPL